MWSTVQFLVTAHSPRNTGKPVPASKSSFLGHFLVLFKRRYSVGVELFDFLLLADRLFTVLNNTYQIGNES